MWLCLEMGSLKRWPSSFHFFPHLQDGAWGRSSQEPQRSQTHQHQVLTRSCRSPPRLLTVTTKHSYTGEVDVPDDCGAGETVVTLAGRLHECGVRSPALIYDSKIWKKGKIICSHHTSLVSYTYLRWPHGSRRRKKETNRREDAGIPFLGM